jgi:hypothetical protein
MKRRVFHLLPYQHQSLVILPFNDLLALCELLRHSEQLHSCYEELAHLCEQTPAYRRLATLLATVNTQGRTVLDGLKKFPSLGFNTEETYPGLLAPNPAPKGDVV